LANSKIVQAVILPHVAK